MPDRLTLVHACPIHPHPHHHLCLLLLCIKSSGGSDFELITQLNTLQTDFKHAFIVLFFETSASLIQGTVCFYHCQALTEMMVQSD